MADERKKVAVLGCTGSIGSQTLDVIANMSDKLRAYSMTAHSRADEAVKLANIFKPEVLVITGACDRDKIINAVPKCTKVYFSDKDIFYACEGADVVLLSILGIAALPAFEYCLKAGIPIALASKEAMVCGGAVGRALMEKTNTPVYPVDSELSAIFQCLEGNEKREIDSILLTASGGPFRNTPLEDMANITKEMAVAHPNWSMGQKISVDSATMANKGLEIMETRWLFNIPADKIKVVVHPESIIHSAVEYADGAVIAQMGVPDMRLPIQYALRYPIRELRIVDKLDLFSVASLHFEPADERRFPCLALAYEAIREGGALQLVFNCADEMAVGKFLKGEIGFTDIPLKIEKAMEHFKNLKIASFEDIYLADKEIRSYLAY